MTEEFNFDSLKIKLQKRSSNSHKGDFGRVMVVGGSEGMGGAAILSSLAAIRTGSGYVRLDIVNERRDLSQLEYKNLVSNISTSYPDIIVNEGLGRKCDNLLFGPGVTLELGEPSKVI